MPHINATLKVNPPKDWTYWMSKPADHYELHYYSETTKRELVIYSSSLNELFRKFFLMSGNFYTTYTLNIPADLNPEKRNKIQGKFNSETEHFTRRLLGIGSNQPLPPKGPPLEAALEEAFINRKQGLKEKIKYQIKQIRKERNIWAGSTGVCAAALTTIGILMAVSVLTPPIGPIVAIIVGGLTLCCAASFGLNYYLHKNLVSEAKKIDQLPDPFILNKHLMPYGPGQYISPQHKEASHLQNTAKSLGLEANPTKKEVNEHPAISPKSSQSPTRKF